METNRMTIDAFIKKVRAVEGFNVEVMDQNVQAGGSKQVKVKLSTRRSPNSWTSSEWIKKRISQESLSKFAFSVRWGNSKSKPQSGTELQAIRESYPAAFGIDAKNAAQVKKKMEESIGELQIKLTRLKGVIKQKKKVIDAEMRALAIDTNRRRAGLKAGIRALETERNDLFRQLEEKSKLADMTTTQIDKKAKSYGRERAKEAASEALTNAFSDLSNQFEGLKDSIQRILEKDDFDANSLVSTLVARLNAAKWDADKFLKENHALRTQLANQKIG